MRRSTATVALIALFALSAFALVACSSGTTGTTGTSTSPPATSGGGTTSGGTATDVAIKGFAFSPDSVDIAVGDSVTWTNDDSATHTVTGDGGIDSKNLAQGDSYTKTFDTAGTFSYHCSIHPSMTGTVIVK